MTTLVFADIESTGTDPTRHHLWEIGLIVRTNGQDREYCWQVRPDLSTADPMALKIGRYYERIGIHYKPVGVAQITTHPRHSTPSSVTAGEVASDVAALLDGAVLAAANVTFDAAFLAAFLRANGQAPAWDYHLLEIESYAAGAIGMQPPWKLDKLAAALGIPPLAVDQRHTALADARLARDVFDAAARHVPAT